MFFISPLIVGHNDILFRKISNLGEEQQIIQVKKQNDRFKYVIQRLMPF